MNPTSHRWLAACAVAALALVPAIFTPNVARAETFQTCAGFIDTVPTTITTQGVWCLRHDLSTNITTGAAITVAANNVTIDCNDFKVGGLAAGLATQAVGVTTDKLNTTVRHCTIRGFWTGVSLTGAGHAVLDSRLDQSTGAGIMVSGDGSVVRGNRVTDTGSAADHSMAIQVSGSAIDVSDNIVAGVAPIGYLMAWGIRIYSDSGSVRGNHISGLVAAESVGITSDQNSMVSFRDNDVLHASSTYPTAGIECNGGSGIAKDNIVTGFAGGISCVDGGGNHVSPPPP